MSEPNDGIKNLTLTDVLRAEAADEDLQEGPHGIHVCAMTEDGDLYELGSVSRSLVVKNPGEAWRAINRIKLSRFANKTMRDMTCD